MNLSQRVALNTLLLLGGRIAVSASGLVGTVVATRYLGEEDFGQLVTAATFVAVFSIFTDLGIWTVAAREIAQHPDNEARVLAAVSLIGLALSAATIVLVLVGAALLYGGHDRELVRRGVLIALAGTLLTAPLGASSAHLTAQQRAVPSAVGGLVAGAGFVVGLGLALLLDLGFTGVACAYLVSTLLNALPPVVAALRDVSLRPGGTAAYAWRLLRTALPQGAILAITAIYFRIDTVLLSLLGTDQDVARYGLAYRVLEFLLLVPMFTMVTLFPEVARASADPERLRMLVQGALSAVLMLTVPMVCIFVGFAPEIVRVAGGPEFDGAAAVLRLLIVAVAFSFPATVFFNALVAMGRQGILVLPLVVVLTVNVVLNYLLVGALDAEGSAWALVVTEAMALAAAWWLFGRVSARPRAQRPVRLGIAGIACAATVAAIRLPLDVPASHPIVVLVLGSTVAGGVYVLAAVALRAVPVEITSAITQLRDRRAPTSTS